MTNRLKTLALGLVFAGIATLASAQEKLTYLFPAPDFLPATPLDYMYGKSLCYRLQDGDHFLLYSVGEDGVDDGGDPRPTDPKKKVISLFDGRDYVWPEPAELKPK